MKLTAARRKLKPDPSLADERGFHVLKSAIAIAIAPVFHRPPGRTVRTPASASWHWCSALRHVRDLLHFVCIEPSEACKKPTIRVVAGEMNRVVEGGERELAHSGRHYQRGGLIVTVVTDPGTRETRVQNISPPALVRALSSAANWERFDGRTEDWVRIDPQARHATVLFDSTGSRCGPPADTGTDGQTGDLPVTTISLC